MRSNEIVFCGVTRDPEGRKPAANVGHREPRTKRFKTVQRRWYRRVIFMSILPLRLYNIMVHAIIRNLS